MTLRFHPQNVLRSGDPSSRNVEGAGEGEAVCAAQTSKIFIFFLLPKAITELRWLEEQKGIKKKRERSWL